jgi:DNA-binding transcriptional MerR regulator
MTKLYYKIGEVCDITGLRPSVLRFWEKEFKQLRPTKSGGGQRFYTAENIELVKLLKKMLYEEKYTIEGAKKKLKNPESRASGTSVETVVADSEGSKNPNEDVKKELLEILDILNS